MLCSLLCSAHPFAKLAGLAAMARNAKRPIVFEPAAPAALSDRNDVIRLPERRREPTIDFSVATFGEFGMQSFPTSNICIGGLPVPTGAKIVSFRSLADSVDDASQLLRIETANATHRPIATLNERQYVVVGRPNPILIGAVVGTPGDAPSIERGAAPTTEPAALIVQDARQSILAKKSGKAMLSDDLGHMAMWPSAHARKQRKGHAAMCMALCASTPKKPLSNFLVPTRCLLDLLRSRPLGEADWRCLSRDLPNVVDRELGWQPGEKLVCLRWALAARLRSSSDCFPARRSPPLR